MTDKDQKDGKSGFSLQGEIKKRKTQEMQRAIDQQRVTDPRRTSQTTNAASTAPDPRRASQTMPTVQPAAQPRRQTQTNAAVPDPRRTSQVTGITKRVTQTAAMPVIHSRRNLMIAGIATFLAVMVLGGTFLLARSSVNTVSPTPTPMSVLPTVSANDVVNYLRQANVPISNLRQLPVDSAAWLATEEIQFDIQRSGGKATFLVLSYASPDRAISDDFRAKANAKFKDWQITPISNILVFTSPDAAPDIKTEMGSHLTSYLLAPYRPFLPTPTAQPASLGTAAATP